MAEQFRTTVSAVFWTEDTESAQTIADAIMSQIPEPDDASTLVTVEFRSDGRPEPPEPVE